MRVFSLSVVILFHIKCFDSWWKDAWPSSTLLMNWISRHFSLSKWTILNALLPLSTSQWTSSINEVNNISYVSVSDRDQDKYPHSIHVTWLLKYNRLECSLHYFTCIKNWCCLLRLYDMKLSLRTQMMSKQLCCTFTDMYMYMYPYMLCPVHL